MNNLDDNLVPALTELGGEPLLGSGFEAEQPDSDSAPAGDGRFSDLLRPARRSFRISAACFGHICPLSNRNGHDNILDMQNGSSGDQVEAFVRLLKEVPFIRDVRLDRSRTEASTSDGLLTILDRERRRFRFQVQIRTSYFDNASVNALIANARVAERGTALPVLIMARYVPRPTGERLLEGGVNFVDLVGNMHLVIGLQERTILGRSEPKRIKEHRRLSAAQIQALFLFATRPESIAWPVREIAPQAGVSKSQTANIRRELAETGAIDLRSKAAFQVSRAIEERLISGYGDVLRPKLFVGRFRSPERDPTEFVEQLPKALDGTSCRAALSGGAAAAALQHFYRGAETTLFLSETARDIQQRLRVLPDRNGPITLLRAFGEVVFWRKVSAVTVAPPWLIYAELMTSADLRAHEAASELRQELLIR